MDEKKTCDEIVTPVSDDAEMVTDTDECGRRIAMLATERLQDVGVPVEFTGRQETGDHGIPGGRRYTKFAFKVRWGVRIPCGNYCEELAGYWGGQQMCLDGMAQTVEDEVRHKLRTSSQVDLQQHWTIGEKAL